MLKIRELIASIIKSAQLRRVKISLIVGAVVIFILAVTVAYHRGRNDVTADKPDARADELEPLPFGAVTSGLKGVDLVGLDEGQRRRALRLLNIATCLASDGMVSVARCRRDTPHCVTSQRMADFIVHKVKEGLEEDVILSRLYEKAVKEGGATALLGKKKIDLPDEDIPALGPKDAPVTITLFYDYTSAVSRMAWDKLTGLQHLYPERVRIRLWPLPRGRVDERAEKAARVALAAHRLGKFDIVHPLLINSEGAIKEGRLDSFTEQAGLEPGVLNGKAVARPTRKKMKRLNKLAHEMGLHYPPVIFVKGRRVKGAVPGTCLMVGAVQSGIAQVITDEYNRLADKITPH